MNQNIAVLSPNERKRRQREREDREEEQLFFQSPDWMDFLDLGTLPRKAGCHPEDLPAVVVNELAANGCDVGQNVSTRIFADTRGNPGIVISDDGPGLNPDIVADIFSPNRDQLSTKHQRRCTSGALGNGTRVVGGAVGATSGTLIVETRGHRLTLALDAASGKMRAAQNDEIPLTPGLSVSVALGLTLPFERDHFDLAKKTIRLLGHGEKYSGPSSPWWYGASDLHRLAREVMPTSTSFIALCHRLGFKTPPSVDPAWKAPARDLTHDQVRDALEALRKLAKPIPPQRLGRLGATAVQAGAYACQYGVATIREAELPFVLEVWVRCEKSQTKGDGSLAVELIVNRSFTAARLHGKSTSAGLTIFGCDLHHRIPGPKTGDYRIAISVTTPFLDIINDGKEPSLRPYLSHILSALSKACTQAYRSIERPANKIGIKEAAWEVMEQAYLETSDNGKLPAQARQVMYSARPYILKRTGVDGFGDKYFTQTLLPDYIEEHPEETAEWDVVFDARGSAVEPHTKRRIPLGTLAVRGYLSEIKSGVQLPDVIDLPALGLYPSAGPVNRYRHVLFIEKEGFGPLLKAGEVAQKYDLLICSSKGMSVVALRSLFDGLHEHGVRKVLVLHDCDISGFSILGTLGTSSRRYQFENKIEVVDLGLRLTDIRELELQTEPIPVDKDPDKQEKKWASQAVTLAKHGATEDEIAFLRTERSELNMLSGRRFLDFLEAKLASHGVTKYVPEDNTTLQAHFQRHHEWQLAQKLLDQHRKQLSAKAAAVPTRRGLRRSVEKLLKEHPTWSWDSAVAALATRPQK